MNRAEHRRAHSAALSKAERKRLGLTVPRGPRPLLKDDDRFRIVIWWLLHNILGFRPFQAAYLTLMLFGPLDVQPAERVNDETVIIVGVPTSKAYDLAKRADYLRRKAEKVLRYAEDHKHLPRHKKEHGWIAKSGYLLYWIGFHAVVGMKPPDWLRDELRAEGWGEQLEEALRRIRTALASNYPPHQRRSSAAVAHLIRHAKMLKKNKAL